jgi:hypothetical protein
MVARKYFDLNNALFNVVLDECLSDIIRVSVNYFQSYQLFMINSMNYYNFLLSEIKLHQFPVSSVELHLKKLEDLNLNNEIIEHIGISDNTLVQNAQDAELWRL